MTDILAEAKPKTIILADGNEYTLPPLTLNTLANIEEMLGCGIDKLQEQFNTKMATTLRNLLYAMLRENYPKLTLEQAGKLVTMDKFKPLVDLISAAVSELRG